MFKIMHDINLNQILLVKSRYGDYFLAAISQWEFDFANFLGVDVNFCSFYADSTSVWGTHFLFIGETTGIISKSCFPFTWLLKHFPV